jgi:hypothetical protein
MTDPAPAPFKRGKLPPQPKPTDFKLSRYVDLSALAEPPRVFGFGGLYPDWGMLGNDRYGDCVFAGGDHETMIFNRERGGVDVPFDADAALGDYSAVTGFSKGDPSSDQGAVVADAAAYRRDTGLADSNGDRHKIAAYVSIDPKDFGLLMRCAFEFTAVGIGFEFPESAWDQFDHGEFWDVVPGTPAPESGHYVPVVGSRNSAARATCVTWGRRQQLTKRFYETYNDESWVYVSEEQIRSDGKGLHGFDIERLKADLAAL